MPIQIGARRDSGFDDPLGMLRDCHRRIERFLHVLGAAAEQACGRALNPEEANAVSVALQYFQSGGRRHNADEEESLFPRLRAVRPEALAATTHLEDEHRHTEVLHRQVEALYRRWLDHAALNDGDQQELRAATAELQHIYAAHIQMEESAVFPQAAEALDAAAIAAIGAEFQARRR